MHQCTAELQVVAEELQPNEPQTLPLESVRQPVNVLVPDRMSEGAEVTEGPQVEAEVAPSGGVMEGAVAGVMKSHAAPATPLTQVREPSSLCHISQP